MDRLLLSARPDTLSDCAVPVAFKVCDEGEGRGALHGGPPPCSQGRDLSHGIQSAVARLGQPSSRHKAQDRRRSSMSWRRLTVEGERQSRSVLVRRQFHAASTLQVRTDIAPPAGLCEYERAISIARPFSLCRWARRLLLDRRCLRGRPVMVATGIRAVLPRPAHRHRDPARRWPVGNPDTWR